MTDAPPGPFDVETFLEERARAGGHGALLGVGYYAHGPDWAELSLPYQEQLIGEEMSRVMASGPILALMDMACGIGVWLKLGRFHNQATLDLRIDYLRPATAGLTVIGHGECYRITRQIAFVRGQAHDGDPANPLAHVTGTFMAPEGYR